MKKTVAYNLRTQRMRQGLTQNELAQSLGIAVSTISMYENGERVPSDEMKIKLAKCFGTTVGTLFFEEKVTQSEQ